MKATARGGKLLNIDDIYIQVKSTKIIAYILPDVSDSKGASYADENAIGRSTPFKNYSFSENRVIQWNHHWIVDTRDRIDQILREIRILQSLVYPSSETKPYAPPNLAKLKLGNILDDKKELCCILKTYSLKYPTDVPWYNDSGKNVSIPYKVDMDLSFEVVYDNSAKSGGDKLPYAEDISIIS